jgi:D-apiose dehydrogenase
MAQKIWRGGMVGAGAWSDIQLTAWAGVENAKIVALCDRHPDRRDPLANRWKIENLYNDLETMLDREQLDFVDVCTRPYSHVALTKQAASRGLPVLCQKPFCANLDEARELVEFCERANVRLMVNENYRWQAWFRKARETLDAGLLGQPFAAKLVRRVRFTLPHFDSRQAYMAEMPQLVLYEVGTHWLDTFRYLFGEPHSIYARTHHISPQVKGEDVAVFIVGYKDMTCTVENSWVSVQVPGLDMPGQSGPQWPRLEIDGTRATLSLGCDGLMRLVSDDDQKQWQFSGDQLAQSRGAAQQHFIDCLESGAEFETSGAETLKTMALVYGAYLSAAENRVVEISELLKQ